MRDSDSQLARAAAIACACGCRTSPGRRPVVVESSNGRLDVAGGAHVDWRNADGSLLRPCSRWSSLQRRRLMRQPRLAAVAASDALLVLFRAMGGSRLLRSSRL